MLTAPFRLPRFTAIRPVCLAILLTGILFAAGCLKAEDLGAEDLKVEDRVIFAADGSECHTIYEPNTSTLFDFVELGKHYPYSPYEGKMIGKIQVSSLPVFNELDPKENYLVYQVLNQIHMDTRETVISNQLLFGEGDVLQTVQLSESERLLRQNPYLIDARIVPLRQCGDTVDLLVVTRDIWTLEPAAIFSQSGGTSKGGIGLSDSNLLGTGIHVAVSYEQDADRSEINYLFKNNHLMGSRVGALIQYGDTSDGAVKVLNLQRPFYSLDANWAAGLESNERSQIDTTELNGIETNAYQHDDNQYTAYFGTSDGLEANFARRWYLGLSKEEDLFEQIPTTQLDYPEDRSLVYPWIAYEQVENRFATYRNLNFIETTEDVALGKQFFLKLGYGGSALGNDISKWRFFGHYDDAKDAGKQHLFFWGADLDGAWNMETHKAENLLVGGHASYINLIDENNRWYTALRADMGTHLYEDSELSLDEDEGLRGFPGGFQTGDRRVLFKLERRYYSNLHILNLFRVGGLAFFDAGRAWQTGMGSETPTLFDAGIGLRLLSSKARTGNVIHLDLAFPLNERENIDSMQVTLKGVAEF